MDFLLMAFVVYAGLHAWSYGRFIGKQGNGAGAVGIYILVVITLSLSLFAIIK